MATRRKSSSFTTPGPEETVSVEEFLNESAQEMFETISQEEEEVEVKNEVVEPEVKTKEEPPKPLILPEIVPTEDVGPRFVEVTETSPKPQETATEPTAPPVPKRHPRNVPKFSRFK